LDQYTVKHGEYVRVTLRAEQPFRGFLIKAVDILDQKNETFGTFSVIGSWHIPYRDDSSASDSKYLHCAGILQSAVTHTGLTINMYVLSLQWRPPDNYHGMVTISASVVRDYQTYWTGIQSTPINVLNNHSDSENDVNSDSYQDNFGEESNVIIKKKHFSELSTISSSSFSTISSSSSSNRHSGAKFEDLSPHLDTPYNVWGDSDRDETQFGMEKIVTPDFRINTDLHTKNSMKRNNMDISTTISVGTEPSKRGQINSEISYKRLESQYGAWEENRAYLNRNSFQFSLCALTVSLIS